jgi:hypothetical protein
MRTSIWRLAYSDESTVTGRSASRRSSYLNDGRQKLARPAVSSRCYGHAERQDEQGFGVTLIGEHGLDGNGLGEVVEDDEAAPEGDAYVDQC